MKQFALAVSFFVATAACTLNCTPAAQKPADQADSYKTNADREKHASQEPAIPQGEHGKQPEAPSPEKSNPSKSRDTDYGQWGFRLNIFLAVATLSIAIFAAIQALAARSTAKVAQATLVSTFRPKLVVRRVSLHAGTIQTPGGRPWRIQYFVANIGGTVAHIYESNVVVEYAEGRLPTNPASYTEEFQSTEQFALKPGEDQEKWIELNEQGTSKVRFLEMRSKQCVDNPALVGCFGISGHIVYRDDIGTVRRTGFCRVYNAETKRFTAVNDLDYEYAD